MMLLSPAKINLSLRILGKRTDGFHQIETRLVRLAFGDTVEIERLGAGTTVSFSCSDATVPSDESNLALKALRAFESRTGHSSSWRIHLEKRIPHGAGLGGGSSNAATILRAANELSGNLLTLPQLLELAAQIGSDVPCFLLDSPVADGTGRGEIVQPADFPYQLHVVLIKPPFSIPTPWAYKKWADSREIPGVLYAPQLCEWGTLVNDLERPVFQKHLLLPALKNWLLEQGETRAALMSGSGSTMFAITDTAIHASDLAAKARAWCGETSWTLATRTANS